MKPKKLGKKLALSKTTVVNLEQKEQGAVKGGYYNTEFHGGCRTWHPVCFTQPVNKCDLWIPSVVICQYTEEPC